MPHLDEKDLLTSLERQFSAHYKEYYLAKRNNLFASIQAFPRLWECFMLLDKIYCREFDDMSRATNLYKSFALLLFINAHAKMRIAMELGMSACLMEAHSIVRDSIESVAHGHRVQDPALLKVWLERNNGAAEKKAYQKEFWDDKTKGLFKGLDQLHALWKQYSEIGSHTNITSLSERFQQEETATDVHWRLHYTGSNPDVLAGSLFSMLAVFGVMEEIVYKVYEDRLRLDDELCKMRQDFSQRRERLRNHMIKALKLSPPLVRP